MLDFKSYPINGPGDVALSLRGRGELEEEQSLTKIHDMGRFTTGVVFDAFEEEPTKKAVKAVMNSLADEIVAPLSRHNFRQGVDSFFYLRKLYTLDHGDDCADEELTDGALLEELLHE